MTWHDWEKTIIQQMIEESNQELKESGKQKVLTAWRGKLTKEPYFLRAFQIDEIVVEYRKRLTSASRQPISSS